MTQLISGIAQIGIVVRSIDDTVRRYRELLGIVDWHFNDVDTAAGKGARFFNRNKSVAAMAIVAWTQLGDTELELIEPRDEDSVYAQFLREQGPGIHHVMLATPDYEVCLGRMRANEVPVLASGELQRTRFHLFDTQADLGMICEIADGDPLIPDRTGLA